jgi:RNA polymerase sigma-70 factor (ECF subfamily)
MMIVCSSVATASQPATFSGSEAKFMKEQSSPSGGRFESSRRQQVDRITDAAFEANLVRRVSEGDQTAIAQVFDRYGSAVYSVALRTLQDTGHAEDVMQEVFIQFWRNPQSFVEGRGSLRGWLVVMARNRSIDLLRGRKPTNSYDERVHVAAHTVPFKAEQNLTMEKIQKNLATLPEEQQQVMELAFFEGLTHMEIAEKTGVALGTVKTRIRSALISLRKSFAV